MTKLLTGLAFIAATALPSLSKADSACAPICTEVVACCMCQCAEDYGTGVLGQACILGCFVIGTMDDADSTLELVFVGNEASPHTRPLDASRETPYVSVEAGAYSPEEGVFRSSGKVVKTVVTFASIDEYLGAEFKGREPRWIQARWTSATRNGTYAATLPTSWLPEALYVVRAQFVLSDATVSESFALLNIR